jgi:hypothetical protein
MLLYLQRNLENRRARKTGGGEKKEKNLKKSEENGISKKTLG